MAFTEDELKAKNVKELKELAKQLGAPVKAKKDDLVASILEAQGAADGAAAGLEDVGDELEDPAAEAAPAAAAGAPAAAAAADAAAGGTSARGIVFNLESKASVEPKKANIVGVKVLSDAERAQLRAAKFGITPAAGSAGGKAAAAGGKAAAATPTLEEEIKRLERGVKYGKASEADLKKLEQLKKKQQAQQEKQRLALDKAELMDPDRMSAREKKFGKPLLGGDKKGIKDPEAMKRRAEKFGKSLAAPAAAAAGGGGGGKAEDEARKKARLERFAAKK